MFYEYVISCIKEKIILSENIPSNIIIENDLKYDISIILSKYNMPISHIFVL